jgi:hypothetical protein
MPRRRRRPVLCVLGLHRWARSKNPDTGEVFEPGDRFTMYMCERCESGLVVENGFRPVAFGFTVPDRR